jgi:hypothetical protein
MSGRRGESISLNGILVTGANQLETLDITNTSPVDGQMLAWDPGTRHLVWDAAVAFVEAGDATTSSWDFGSPFDGGDATTTVFPAISDGGNSNTF